MKEQEAAERQRKEDEKRRKAEEERLRKEAEKKLAFKSKDIWNAGLLYLYFKSIQYET